MKKKKENKKSDNLSICTHVININNLLIRNLYIHPNLYIFLQNMHGFHHLPLQNHKEDFNTSIQLHNGARCLLKN